MVVKYIKKGQQPTAEIQASLGSVVTTHTTAFGEVATYEGEPALVGFKAGVTKNMGDFNSLRVDVSLQVPCAPTKEAIDTAYTEAKTWADERINALLDELGDG